MDARGEGIPEGQEAVQRRQPYVENRQSGRMEVLPTVTVLQVRRIPAGLEGTYHLDPAQGYNGTRGSYLHH